MSAIETSESGLVARAVDWRPLVLVPLLIVAALPLI